MELSKIIFGRPVVKRFPYAIGPLSVLSVCNVGVLRPNGWVDQDETWHGGRPRPRPHCVGWRLSSPSPKGDTAAPHFSARVLWSNGWMNQDASWYGDRPRPRPHCISWKPNSAVKGHSPPHFRPVSVVANGRPSQLLLSTCWETDWSRD